MDNMKKLLETAREKFKFITNVLMKSSELGELLEWNKFIKEIPYIAFDPSWEVKIVPPFTGAMIRFYIRKKDRVNDNFFVSVYLDCFEILGKYNLLSDQETIPYWEVYPYNELTHRIMMNNTDDLVEAIRYALDNES